MEQKTIIKAVEGARVKLEKSPFFAGGGGQPGDKGEIIGDDLRAEVVGFEGDWILINIIKGIPRQGMEVQTIVDQQRRGIFSKMHSGEHIFFRSLQNCTNAEIEKVQINELESVLYVVCHNLTWEEIFKAEQNTNCIINDNRKVITKIINKNEEIPGLRIKKDKIRGDNVKVVEVEDFDVCACTGTHVQRTGEIGNFIVTSFKSLGNKYEIRFKVNSLTELYSMANASRLSASLLNTEAGLLFPRVKSLLDEKENMKQRLREASGVLLKEVKKEEINGITLLYNVFNGIDKKQILDRAKEICGDKTVVCFVNKTDEKALVFILTSGRNASDLIKLTENFNGQGGGKENFASGSIRLGSAQEFIEKLKKSI